MTRRTLFPSKHYKRLEAGLDRLKGTGIKTNILTGGARIKHGFGLIGDWKIIEKSSTDGRMIAVEVALSEWLYNAIAAREVLTLNRDYFRLGGALERRLYELAPQALRQSGAMGRAGGTPPQKEWLR